MKFDNDLSVTRQDALKLMKENWSFTPEKEIVPLNDCLGRVLAEDLYSKNTLPLVRSSCFDGIAVRSSDFANGMPDTSKWVKGVDYVRADTGDDFPDAFDCVIAVEQVIFEGESMRFVDGFEFDPEKKNVNPSGILIAKDTLLAPAHTKITPEIMVSLAMGGITWVPVIRKIKVIFIPTGSELIQPGDVPQRGQNIDTNGLMIKHLLEQRGAEVTCHSIVRDNKNDLEKALDESLAWADMVLINGGSSRGEEDYNSLLLQKKGSFFRHGVKAAPGRPIGLAVINGKAAINVPGPIMATQLAEHWLLSSLVQYWYGLPDHIYPTVKARLTAPIAKRAGMEFLSRVVLTRTPEGYTASPMPRGFKGGIPAQILAVNGLVNIPLEADGLEEGAIVEVELLKDIEFIPYKAD